MELLWLIFFEFFKVGLFAIGGGLATIPFLVELAETYHWFPIEMLSNMIAVSESTPGPIGINMATYVGFHTNGILGAIVATIGLVAPSVIIICMIAKILKKFKESNLIKGIFYGLRPAVAALIITASSGIFIRSLFYLDAHTFLDFFHWTGIGLFLICFFIYQKWKPHPIIIITMMAMVGIILQL